MSETAVLAVVTACQTIALAAIAAWAARGQHEARKLMRRTRTTTRRPAPAPEPPASSSPAGQLEVDGVDPHDGREIW